MKAQQPNTEWTVFDDGKGTMRYRRRYPNDDTVSIDPAQGTDDGGHRIELWWYQYKRWNGVVVSGWLVNDFACRVECDLLQKSFASGERTPTEPDETHYQHTAADAE